MTGLLRKSGKTHRKECLVTRFRGDGEHGPGYRFGDQRFRSGEYVSIRKHDGITRILKVISVDKLN